MVFDIVTDPVVLQGDLGDLVWYTGDDHTNDPLRAVLGPQPSICFQTGTLVDFGVKRTRPALNESLLPSDYRRNDQQQRPVQRRFLVHKRHVLERVQDGLLTQSIGFATGLLYASIHIHEGDNDSRPRFVDPDEQFLDPNAMQSRVNHTTSAFLSIHSFQQAQVASRVFDFGIEGIRSFEPLRLDQIHATTANNISTAQLYQYASALRGCAGCYEESKYLGC